MREQQRGVVDSQPEGGRAGGKAVRKSEPEPSETGAGVTFSENRENEGGSTKSQRGTRKVLIQPVRDTTSETGGDNGYRTFEKDGPPVEVEIKESTTPIGKRITRAGWRDVEAGDPDPGTGFYRFAAADIEGLPERSMMAKSIEVFGTDLRAAQTFLARLVNAAKKVNPKTVEPLDVRPRAHRATRLCKAARKARGE